MLPQIELLSPEVGLKAEHSSPTPEQVIDFAKFDAIFADFQSAPILAGQTAIEFPEGRLLPENGDALPPAVIEPDQRMVPQEPATKPGPLLDTVRLQRRGVPRSTFPEITHVAEMSSRRRAGLARGSELPVRPDEGLRSPQLHTQVKSTKHAAPDSSDTRVDRPPVENAYAMLRRLTGLPQFVELPEIVAPPPPSAKPQLPVQGAQYTAATPELLMSPPTKNDTVPPADRQLEPIESGTPTDGHKPWAQSTTAASFATVSGDTTAATTLSIQMRASAVGTSMVSTPAPSQLVMEINIPVLDAEWGTMLNERVTWMANRNIQNAEIRMNPAELGPLRVQVSIDDGSAQVVFSAQHAATREAIELALPRLREMLSDYGLLLADVSVSDQEVHHGQAGVERESTSEIASADASFADGEDQSSPAVVHARPKSGLVDTFV